MSTLTNQESNYLVISSIGSDQPGIVNALASTCSQNQCNIVDSRMTVLGGEFAVIMMVSGETENIEALTQKLPEVSQALNLTTTLKQTHGRNPCQSIVYNVDVVAIDNPGIVHEIAQYFSSQNINIDDLHTGTYSAPHTGTQMFKLSMSIRLAADIQISKLKDGFMDFCDELNLDASIEPHRMV